VQSGIRHELDGGLPEADPAHKAPEKPRTFGHTKQGIHNPAVHETEVRRIRCELDVADSIQDSVKRRGARALEEPGMLAARPHREDDIEARLPLGDELGHDFRRMLKIGIHHDDRLPGSVLEAGGDRDLMTEIPRQADSPYARVELTKLSQDSQRTIGAAIIDKYQLVRVANLSHLGRQQLVNGPDILLFVVDG
jgi:hypothetical protein